MISAGCSQNTGLKIEANTDIDGFGPTWTENSPYREDSLSEPEWLAAYLTAKSQYLSTALRRRG